MDTGDEDLRDLLAAADPAVGASAPAGLLQRVLDTADDPVPARQTWLQRRWQPLLLGAAAAATLALATPVVAPGLFAGDDAPAAVSELAPAADGGADSAGSLAQPAPGDVTEQSAPAPRLARSASLLVGTDDPAAQGDTFVAAVTALGGAVLSESVVTQGSSVVTAPDVAVSSGIAAPYPWYPSGPGVFLTVEVPEARYAEALRAARDTGEVVQLQQSSYDVGAQIADVEARIAALETSLRTLTGLFDRAETVTDVVALETAIAQRQSELDGLQAQQRDLVNQTSMSRLSLSLMSPDDARGAVDPQPPRSWWQSFLDGLADLWSWLGAALLITSPLILAAAVVWWARRRRRT